MSITSGSASDMEQYRAMVGEIQGISFALDEIKTLLKRYIEDE
jgi:conjugal transfer/entry exclusion protein